MHLRTLLASALTGVALITGSGFVVTHASESAASGPDEAAVVRAVRTRWGESGLVDGAAMHIQVVDGTVVIEGRARSEAEALFAEDLASRVDGVSRVENRLAIDP